ncbi:MAG: acyltransferase [Endomicrobia bacterium]|nr:acyltransferase [Endomicrobiia bacterium]
MEQIVSEKFSSQIIVDAKKGRKFEEAIDRVNLLDQYSLLKDKVIIALGTNGPFTLQEAIFLTDYLLELGKSVYFVNVKVPRPWEKEVNTVLKELKNLRNEVKLIEWNPSYKKLCKNVICFKKDGYHLTDIGSFIYANFIINSIND